MKLIWSWSVTIILGTPGEVAAAVAFDALIDAGNEFGMSVAAASASVEIYRSIGRQDL